MERGSLIAYHRKRLNLTQTELGEKVNVTAQAVSKWENGLSEPDLSTVQKLCKIFGIDVTEFFSEEEGTPADQTAPQATSAPAEPVQSAEAPAPTQPVVAQPVPEKQETTRFIVGYCSTCKRPIEQREKYEVFTRRGGAQTITCPQCAVKNRIRNAEFELSRERTRFRRSMITGGCIAGGIAVIVAIIAIATKNVTVLAALALVPMSFTFASQCFWDGIVSDCFFFFLRSFRMPGLIFALNLEGIIWFITVKLLLMILSGLLSVLFILLGVAVSLVFSLFVFPFGMMKEAHTLNELKRNVQVAKARA